MLQQFINKMSLNPKLVFLMDGLGALVSAFSLGVILVKFEDTFGMPKEVLFYLSGAACVFAVYDIFCYFFAKENWKPFLKGIAFTNIIYCIVSAVLVFYFFQKLTTFGHIYFLLEIAVILVVVFIELKIAAKSSI